MAEPDELPSTPLPETSAIPRAIPFTSSSQIADISYSDKEMELYVTFQRSGTYRYFQVPSDVADGFTNAPSAGRYLNEFIKGLYDYERIG